MEITAPANPTKAHHTFAGWFYDNDDFEIDVEFPIDVDEYTLNGEFGSVTETIYAKWTINQYTISFNMNDADSAQISPITQNALTTIVEPTEPTRDGFDFLGWYTQDVGGTQVSFPMSLTATQTIHARWVAVYTVTLNFNDGETENQLITDREGTTVVKPVDPTRDNHDFLGWFTQATGGTQVSFPFNLTESRVVYAQWYKYPDFNDYLDFVMDVGYYFYDDGSYSGPAIDASNWNFQFTKENATCVRTITIAGDIVQIHSVVDGIEDYKFIVMNNGVVSAYVKDEIWSKTSIHWNLVDGLYDFTSGENFEATSVFNYTRNSLSFTGTYEDIESTYTYTFGTDFVINETQLQEALEAQDTQEVPEVLTFEEYQDLIAAVINYFLPINIDEWTAEDYEWAGIPDLSSWSIDSSLWNFQFTKERVWYDEEEDETVTDTRTITVVGDVMQTLRVRSNTSTIFNRFVVVNEGVVTEYVTEEGVWASQSPNLEAVDGLYDIFNSEISNIVIDNGVLTFEYYYVDEEDDFEEMRTYTISFGNFAINETLLQEAINTAISY